MVPFSKRRYWCKCRGYSVAGNTTIMCKKNASNNREILSTENHVTLIMPLGHVNDMQCGQAYRKSQIVCEHDFFWKNCLPSKSPNMHRIPQENIVLLGFNPLSSAINQNLLYFFPYVFQNCLREFNLTQNCLREVYLTSKICERRSQFSLCLL